MVPKHTLYKRKLRSFLAALFFSTLLFLGVFGVCMGMWFFLHTRPVPLKSPLPVAASGKKAYSAISQVENLCNKCHLFCTNITMDGGSAVSLFVGTNEQVIVSLEKDLPTQIASLQLTIAHLTIEGKQFKQLDFRFDKPVLTF